MSTLRVERVSGQAIASFIPELAALRIEVFRAYPYLYEGSLEYEQRYLRSYTHHPHSTLVLARDGDVVVGASTALPLAEHGEELAPLCQAARIEPTTVYYFGESVLRASHRGRGLGHAFFDQREAAAREHGYARCAFCAVQRSPDDPRRPRDYVPLDAFWQRRGYEKRADLVTTFAWRDLGEANETEKPMQFWIKELTR